MKTVEELKTFIETTLDKRVTDSENTQIKKMNELKEDMKKLIEENNLWSFRYGLTTLLRHIKSFNYTDDFLQSEERNKLLTTNLIKEYMREDD